MEHCTCKSGKKGKLRKTPFIWTDSQQKAYETLKEKLISAPILAYADYSLPCKLHTDASNVGIGVILYQRQDDVDRVVAFASRSRKPSEKIYPAHKKVQVGKDQEKAQSEKDSHSKNRDGKKLN